MLVRDGAIEAVGAAAEAPALEPDERIDARGCIVVPGLINTHQHHWYNLFKGLGAGMLLEQWIQNLLVPTARALTPRDLEVSGRLACLEMLSTGTTAYLNHSVSLTGLDEVEATVAPGARVGNAPALRQGDPPRAARGAARARRGGAPALRRRRRRPHPDRLRDREHRALGGARHLLRGARGARQRAGRPARRQDRQSHRRRHDVARQRLPQVRARDGSHRPRVPAAARRARPQMGARARDPLARPRHRADRAPAARRSRTRPPASPRAAAASPRSPGCAGPACSSRSAPTARWSTRASTWSSR